MAHSIMQFKLPDGRWDMTGYARSLGHRALASHCPNCGKFAREIAGDHSVRDKIFPDDPEPHPWYRTDCKKCGVWEVVLEYKPWPQYLPRIINGWQPKSITQLEARGGPT
jgi:hypothetical protein